MNELSLRLMGIDDAPKIFHLVDSNRQHLRAWLGWVDSVKTTADSITFIQSTIDQRLANKGEQFAICINNEIIGIIGQHQVNWTNKVASIGYWIGKNFIGHGYMTKACQQILKLSFEVQNLNSVEIAAAVENSKSRAIPERLGFKLDGILRQREFLYDHFVDHAVYTLLKSEYKNT